MDTVSPTATSGTAARLAYWLVRPFPWSISTVVPMKGSSNTLDTVPAAVAMTLVPRDTARSIPSWVRQSPMVSL